MSDEQRLIEGGEDQQLGVRGKFDFKTTLFLQMNRCGQILSTLPKEQGSTQVGATYNSIVSSYTNSVRYLEALLSPYWDEVFKNEREEARTVYERAIAEADVNEAKLAMDMYFSRFEAAIRLINRWGLLLESTEVDVVE